MATDKAQAEGGVVVETVDFRLRAGVLPADFVKMAEQGTGYLTTLPGFRRRYLVEEAGSWQDIIEWASMEAAQAAMPLVMAHPAFAGFMAAIDPASIEMRHSALHLTISA